MKEKRGLITTKFPKALPRKYLHATIILTPVIFLFFYIIFRAPLVLSSLISVFLGSRIFYFPFVFFTFPPVFLILLPSVLMGLAFFLFERKRRIIPWFLAVLALFLFVYEILVFSDSWMLRNIGKAGLIPRYPKSSAWTIEPITSASFSCEHCKFCGGSIIDFKTVDTFEEILSFYEGVFEKGKCFYTYRSGCEFSGANISFDVSYSNEKEARAGEYQIGIEDGRVEYACF